MRETLVLSNGVQSCCVNRCRGEYLVLTYHLAKQDSSILIAVWYQI